MKDTSRLAVSGLSRSHMHTRADSRNIMIHKVFFLQAGFAAAIKTGRSAAAHLNLFSEGEFLVHGAPTRR